MIAMELTLIDLAARFGLIVLTIGMVLSLYRIVRGPERADRIVALDLLSILVTAVIVLYAIYSGQTAFMDVAIAYALVDRRLEITEVGGALAAFDDLDERCVGTSLVDLVPELIGGVLPPGHKNIYFFGLGQPRYGAGPLISAGAETLCTMVDVQQQLDHFGLGRDRRRAGFGPHKDLLALLHHDGNRFQQLDLGREHGRPVRQLADSLRDLIQAHLKLSLRRYQPLALLPVRIRLDGCLRLLGDTRLLA